MAGDADLGLLCHKSGGGKLCFKKNGAKLVFKARAGEETVVTFAWSSDVRDLDILAYWDGAPSLTAGYGHGSGGTSGHYSIVYSGDNTSVDASEWCKIKMTPWGSGDTRTFRVHFNVYGFDDEHSGSTCTVIASQPNGQTLIKRNQQCSTRIGQAAATTDPACVVTFDAQGNLVSLT